MEGASITKEEDNENAREKIIMVNDNAKCISCIAVMIKDTAE